MDGGGALMNQGIHGVQLLLHLMGRVRSVKAYTRTLVHDIEVEDTAVVSLEFQNGALGNIIAATSTKPGFGRRISVHGEHGFISLVNENVDAWSIPGEMQNNPSDSNTDTSSDPKAFGHYLNALQIRDFIEACERNVQPTLSISEGRKPVELILAIYESSRTGKTIYFE